MGLAEDAAALIDSLPERQGLTAVPCLFLRRRGCRCRCRCGLLLYCRRCRLGRRGFLLGSRCSSRSWLGWCRRWFGRRFGLGLSGGFRRRLLRHLLQVRSSRGLGGSCLRCWLGGGLCCFLFGLGSLCWGTAIRRGTAIHRATILNDDLTTARAGVADHHFVTATAWPPAPYRARKRCRDNETVHSHLLQSPGAPCLAGAPKPMLVRGILDMLK